MFFVPCVALSAFAEWLLKTNLPNSQSCTEPSHSAFLCVTVSGGQGFEPRMACIPTSVLRACKRPTTIKPYVSAIPILPPPNFFFLGGFAACNGYCSVKHIGWFPRPTSGTGGDRCPKSHRLQHMPMLDLHVPSYVLPLFAAITTERSRTALNRIVLVAERRNPNA